MHVWDSQSSVESPDSLHFDAAEHALSELGFIVENVLVQHALIQLLRSSGVVLNFDTRISAVRRSNQRFDIESATGRSMTPDLIVGADGATSLVRTEAGIPVRNWSYDQKAFVTHLRPGKDHRHTAWQRFLRSGPFGLLPLADGRVSLVWSTTPEQAKLALECPEPQLASMLTEASDRVLGELQPAGPRGAFPLNAQYASKYVLPGLALIGDAAHSIHPLAGQGANLGLADAAMLAEVVTNALGDDGYPGDLPVLRRYERARKGANQTMLHFIDSLSRIFGADVEPLAGLRGAGMRIFNQSGPIKRRAVQVALGMDHRL